MVSVLTVLPLVAGAAFAASPFSKTLLKDETLWGDGNAEVSIYQAQERRYKTTYPAEVRHLLVRESFGPNAQVKTDNWQQPGAYPVIKLIQFTSFPTGTYKYEISHSAFWDARSGDLIKWSLAHADSCGNTYKQANRTPPGPWRYRAFTYWDGMDESDVSVTPPANTLFYDELPFRLRLIDWGRVTLFEVPLVFSTISSKADKLEWRSAAFAVEKIREGWRVTVKHARGSDQLTFSLASPHVLQRWDRWDDTSLTLKSTVRIPYWQLNQPGDERYLLPTAQPMP